MGETTLNNFYSTEQQTVDMTEKHTTNTYEEYCFSPQEINDMIMQAAELDLMCESTFDTMQHWQ